MPIDDQPQLAGWGMVLPVACLTSDITDASAQVDRVDSTLAFVPGVCMRAHQRLPVSTVDQGNDIRGIRTVENAMLPGPIRFIPRMPHEVFQAVSLPATGCVAQPGRRDEDFAAALLQNPVDSSGGGLVRGWPARSGSGGFRGPRDRSGWGRGGNSGAIGGGLGPAMQIPIQRTLQHRLEQQAGDQSNSEDKHPAGRQALKPQSDQFLEEFCRRWIGTRHPTEP